MNVNSLHFSPCDGCSAKDWMADVEHETAVSFGATAHTAATFLNSCQQTTKESIATQVERSAKLNDLSLEGIQDIMYGCIKERLAGRCYAKPESSRKVNVSNQYL
jgi:hypothetical protein